MTSGKSSRRFILATLGSLGDLHPAIAMGRLLLAAGHEVVVATHVDYRERVERAGLTFLPQRPSLADVGPEEEWAAKANDPRHGAEFIMGKIIMPFIEDNYRALKDIVREGDVVIFQLLAFAAPLVAEIRGLTAISCILQPATMMSRHDPPTLDALPILRPAGRLGPWTQDLFHTAGRVVSNRFLRPYFDLRKKLGLAPGPHPLFGGQHASAGSLLLFPEVFATRQADWPERARTVGFPLLPRENAKSLELSPGLVEFLERGPPPAVFTLGSAIVWMDTKFFAAALAAVRDVGIRAVFVAGEKLRSVPEAALSDPNIHASTYEPYSELFPRAAVVAHQCGIGTTSEALRAAVPQLAVPFAHDQPDNARRVAELGCGVVERRFAGGDGRHFARALRTLTGGAFNARCAAVSAELRKDDFSKNFFAALRSFGVVDGR